MNSKDKSTKPYRQGIITPNGVILEAHETATVIYFTELGFDIELIPRSQVEGIHKPDIIMDNLEWEIKAPKGDGKWVIINTIQRAIKQSANIIIDLRRTKRNQDKCISDIRKEFEKSRSIKRILIITKPGNLIDLRR